MKTSFCCAKTTTKITAASTTELAQAEVMQLLVEKCKAVPSKYKNYNMMELFPLPKVNG